MSYDEPDALDVLCNVASEHTLRWLSAIDGLLSPLSDEDLDTLIDRKPNQWLLERAKCERATRVMVIKADKCRIYCVSHDCELGEGCPPGSHPFL